VAHRGVTPAASRPKRPRRRGPHAPPVHLVARHLTLEFTGHIANHCTDVRHGTVNVGFDLRCTMPLELTVNDDLTVTGSGGPSCGTGTFSDVQPCVPQMLERWEPVAGWSLDEASGKIDDVSGAMDLSVTGSRIGMPRLVFKNGKATEVHANALFPRPFTIGADDGAFRSFGSMTTNEIAGATNAFTIHAK
jgi:hypothetical protein